MRWLMVTAVVMGSGCGTQHAGARNAMPEAQVDLLREFGFVSCLVAGGVHNDATDVAQSFYLESIDVQPERFQSIARCANVYLKGRHNILERNLVIPYCLDFLKSPQLTAALTVKAGKEVDCGTHEPPARPPSSPLPALGMASPSNPQAPPHGRASRSQLFWA
jgi:hypothetical protein